MKKLALTIAIILGITLGAHAQMGGGLFQRGAVMDEEYYGAGGYGGFMERNMPLFGSSSYANSYDMPGLPGHGSNENMDAPLGGGALLLIGFGAAYALKKRNKK